jgi:hypothetical protein
MLEYSLDHVMLALSVLYDNTNLLVLLLCRVSIVTSEEMGAGSWSQATRTSFSRRVSGQRCSDSRRASWYRNSVSLWNPASNSRGHGERPAHTVPVPVRALANGGLLRVERLARPGTGPPAGDLGASRFRRCPLSGPVGMDVKPRLVLVVEGRVWSLQEPLWPW